MTIQAKVPILLEGLQSHNTEDALFPHICCIKVIIIINIIIIIIKIIINNIIMMMMIMMCSLRAIYFASPQLGSSMSASLMSAYYPVFVTSIFIFINY